MSDGSAEYDVSKYLKDLKPLSDEELAEVDQIVTEHNREQKKRVSAKEKLPVTGKFLQEILESDNFQNSLQGIIAEASRESLTGKLEDMHERGFLVWKKYDSNETNVGETNVGEHTHVKPDSGSTNLEDNFAVIDLHWEPAGGVQKVIAPNTYHEDAGTLGAGDLFSLVTGRSDTAESYGVDTRPVMIIVHGGTNMGEPRMMLIQEKSEEDMPQELKDFPLELIERMKFIQTEVDDEIRNASKREIPLQERLNQIYEENGFNVWTTPVKDSYAEDLSQLERFAFTPTNIPQENA